MDINIASMGPRGQADWNDYVYQKADGNLYQLWQWRRIIESSYRHPTYYLSASRNKGTGTLAKFGYHEARVSAKTSDEDAGLYMGYCHLST